jgi:hypothetical protein
MLREKEIITKNPGNPGFFRVELYLLLFVRCQLFQLFEKSLSGF